MAGTGPIRIISGGQSGADRAALDVALALKIPCGGWCPVGRRAEDGPIPLRYPLSELPADHPGSRGYRARTRANVREADATVIFFFAPLTGGSRATADDCQRFGKPCLLVDASEQTAEQAALRVAVFVLQHGVRTLNVAGPRASSQPGIYRYVTDALALLLAPPRGRRRRRAKLRRGS